MADSTPKSYATDPTLYLYTSLSSGSSHIVTATSRLETILKANKVPFRALDVATDEKARMLWGRRAGKRKLPGLVRMGVVVGVRWNASGLLQGSAWALIRGASGSGRGRGVERVRRDPGAARLRSPAVGGGKHAGSFRHQHAIEGQCATAANGPAIHAIKAGGHYHEIYNALDAVKADGRRGEAKR